VVFGEVEGDASRHRRRDPVAPGLLAVAIDIDMQALLGNVVAVVAGRIVIVADDRRSLPAKTVLELDDEPDDLALVNGDSRPLPSAAAYRDRPFSVVLPRLLGHARIMWSYTHKLSSAALTYTFIMVEAKVHLQRLAAECRRLRRAHTPVWGLVHTPTLVRRVGVHPDPFITRHQRAVRRRNPSGTDGSTRRVKEGRKLRRLSSERNRWRALRTCRRRY